MTHLKLQKLLPLAAAAACLVALVAASPATAATVEDCAACHDDVAGAFADTHHGRLFRFDEHLQTATCESCHGPGDAHVESGDPADILNPAKLEGGDADETCMSCHSGQRSHGNWKGSEHQAAGVTCADCHAVHQARPPRRGRLATVPAVTTTGGGPASAEAVVTETCLSCHTDVRNKMNRTSHHPVREGQLSCASCHDPHGSTGPALLRQGTVNETCASCHAEKRGPFVWEHAPVRESCASCHDAHGSNNRALLTAKDSMLCMQCHSYGGHINLPRYNRTSNSYGQGCVNCHITVHGSNHPSGAKFTR